MLSYGLVHSLTYVLYLICDADLQHASWFFKLTFLELSSLAVRRGSWLYQRRPKRSASAFKEWGVPLIRLSGNIQRDAYLNFFGWLREGGNINGMQLSCPCVRGRIKKARVAGSLLQQLPIKLRLVDRPHTRRNSA